MKKWLPKLKRIPSPKINHSTKDIEMLENRWNKCITLKGDYIDKWSRIMSKNSYFISHPTKLLTQQNIIILLRPGAIYMLDMFSNFEEDWLIILYFIPFARWKKIVLRKMRLNV